MRRFAPLLAAALAFVASPALAQSLAVRVLRAPADQPVSFEFPARADVCGYGDAIIRFHDDSPRGYSVSYARSRGDLRDLPDDLDRAELRRRCEFGPVRVLLERAADRVEQVTVRVGGEAPATGNLGSVTTAEAVAWLVDLARTTPRARGTDPLFALSLAAGEHWPALLQLARDRGASADTRKRAIFWLAQAAGDRATVGLRGILADDSEELEVRTHAVFALSQLSSGDAVATLIDVAETAREPAIRRHALFWLGQKEDPRVLALFEKILLDRS